MSRIAFAISVCTVTLLIVPAFGKPPDLPVRPANECKDAPAPILPVAGAEQAPSSSADMQEPTILALDATSPCLLLAFWNCEMFWPMALYQAATADHSATSR